MKRKGKRNKKKRITTKYKSHSIFCGGNEFPDTLPHKRKTPYTDNTAVEGGLAMADLKFFFDPVSQPSRAVWIFLDANQIPYQSCLVEIAKGIMVV